MSVGDGFEECVAKRVPGIPFCNTRDEVVGRVSFRHTLKMTCVPNYLVKEAHLLTPLCWALPLGVGLGANGTHIAATANIIVVSEPASRRRSSV